MPAVGGISTEAIAGELDGAASVEEVAEDFGLDVDAVRWAHSYELSQHAVALNSRAAQVRIYVDFLHDPSRAACSARRSDGPLAPRRAASAA